MRSFYNNKSMNTYRNPKYGVKVLAKNSAEAEKKIKKKVKEMQKQALEPKAEAETITE